MTAKKSVTETADKAPLPIHQALAAVMADVEGVGKNGTNTQSNYKFRGIDAVLNAVGPAMRKHGVLPLPELLEQHNEVVEVGQKRSRMNFVRLKVRYTFTGPAGDSLAAVVPGEAMDSGDKAISKAMSVALRIALIQSLALPTDEPDPDETTHELSPRQPPERIREVPARQESANPERATEEQLQDMSELLGRLNITDAQKQLEMISLMVGRDVTDLANLGFKMANKIIVALQGKVNGQQPKAKLVTEEQLTIIGQLFAEMEVHDDDDRLANVVASIDRDIKYLQDMTETEANRLILELEREAAERRVEVSTGDEQININLDGPVAEQANLVNAVNEVASATEEHAQAVKVMTAPAGTPKVPEPPRGLGEEEKNAIILDVNSLNLTNAAWVRYMKATTGQMAYGNLDEAGWSALAAKTAAVLQGTEALDEQEYPRKPAEQPETDAEEAA